MEQNKGHHHDNPHQHEHARRDDLTWTQYITNLAANRLAPPKSQTLKVLEDHLSRLNEELLTRGESRVKDRTGGDDSESDATLSPESQNREVDKQGAASKNGLAVSLNDVLAVNRDNGQPQEALALASGAIQVDKFSFSDGQRFGRPDSQVQLLHHSLSQGSRWIDVLWQFIAAHQKRVFDLERLGVEPCERMDIQVDMIRQIAATYEKLAMLTRLPDSLSKARECKMVDDIRTMALVYVARKMMDVASPDQIAGANDDENPREYQKRVFEFPRSVISPYEGIRPIEFDPMDLIMAA